LNLFMKMAGNKTRDGLKLTKIVRALLTLPGIEIREGGKHPYVAHMTGYNQPCPIATITDARRMVVPWICRATEHKDSERVYLALREGGWK